MVRKVVQGETEKQSEASSSSGGAAAPPHSEVPPSHGKKRAATQQPAAKAVKDHPSPLGRKPFTSKTTPPPWSLTALQLQVVDRANLRAFRGFRPGQQLPMEKFFEGVKNLYFHGSPGCGKTIVVACICSALVSKWHNAPSSQERERPPRIVILVPDNEIKMQTLRTLHNFTANVAVLADHSGLGDVPFAWCKVSGKWEQAQLKYLDASADEQGVTDVFKYFSISRPSDDCPSEDCWDVEVFKELPETFRDAFKARGIEKEVYEEVKHARPYMASTKEVEALSAWPMVVVCTYQQLTCSSRSEQPLAARLGPLKWVAMDEAHRIVNHTFGQDWKSAVAKLCQQAEKVYAFSGSPLEDARFEGGDFETVKWSVEDALRAGDIVRFEPLPVDAHFFDTLLSKDTQFFHEAIADLHRKGNQKKLYLDMRRDLTTVLALVGFMVLHNRYFRIFPDREDTSPWVNTLLVTDRNHHGSDLEKLIRLVVSEDGAPLLKSCLERLVGMHPFNEPGADCSELLQDVRLLEVFHPYENKKERPVCLEKLRRVPAFPVASGELLGPLEPMPMYILTCSRWATEGTDIPSLHAVVHARYGMSKVGMIQSNARANRPSPLKKHGYLLAFNCPEHHADLDFLDRMQIDESGEESNASETDDDASSHSEPPPTKKRKQEGAKLDGAPRRVVKHEDSIDAIEAIMQSSLAYSKSDRNFCVYAMPERYEDMRRSMADLRYTHLRSVRGNCHVRWPDLPDFGSLGSETLVIVCLYELDLRPNGVLICLCLLTPCDKQRISKKKSNWKMQYLDVRKGVTELPAVWTRSEIYEMLKLRGGCEAHMVWDSARRSLRSKGGDEKFIFVRGPDEEGAPLAAVDDVTELVFKKAPTEHRGIIISGYEDYEGAFLFGNQHRGMKTDLHGGCSHGNMAFTTWEEKWNCPFFLLAFEGDAVHLLKTDTKNSELNADEVDAQTKIKRQSSWKCRRDCEQSERGLMPVEEFVLCATVSRLKDSLVVVAPLGGKRGVHCRPTKAPNVPALLELKLADSEKDLLWTAVMQTDRRFRLYSQKLQKYLYWRQRKWKNDKRAEVNLMVDCADDATLFEARPAGPNGAFKIYANEESQHHQNLSCGLVGQIRYRKGRGRLPTVSQQNGCEETLWYAVPASGFLGTSARYLDEFSLEMYTFSDPEPHKPSGGYDASRMTPAHDLWKGEVIQKCIALEKNALFTKLSGGNRPSVVRAVAAVLAQRRGCTLQDALTDLEAMEEKRLLEIALQCSLWVYFDDYDKQGALRVTTALLDAGRPAASLYCANPKKEIYKELHKLNVNASNRRIEDALPSNAWAGASFSVAYLDSCYGKWESLFRIMDKMHAKKMLQEGALVVVTLCPRGGKGQPPLERIRELSEKISILGFEVVDVGIMQEEHRNIHTKFFRFTTV